MVKGGALRVVGLTVSALSVAACAAAGGATLSPIAACTSMVDALAVVRAPAATASLPDVARYADLVSRRLEAASVDVRRAGGTAAVSLAGHLDDAVNALDDVAVAARSNNRDAVTEKVLLLNAALAAAHAPAKALDASGCAVKAVLTDFSTTTTTEPPEVSLSPETVPLDTSPATNSTPVTSDAVTANQRLVSIADTVTDTADTSFSDVTDAMAQRWLDTFNSTAAGAATSGEYGGVEVTDSFGNTYARAFVFTADQQLKASLAADLLKVLAGDASVRTAVIGAFSGSTYRVAGEGVYFFSALADSRTVFWAVSPTTDGLVTAVRALQGVN